MGWRSGIGGAVLLAACLGMAPQDAAHQADYRKCKACGPALGRAMAYVKSHLRSDKPRRVIGSKLGGYVFAGFAFMIEGRSPKELQECVKYACQAIRDEGYNRNWYLGMCMIFLAEYAVRYGFTPEVERALADGLKLAAKQQEETGGWCHHLEMWKKDGYHRKGGGRDLGMITAMVYGAFLELTSLGVEVGPMMDRARKNLEAISDGAGVRYGTDNGVGDAAMARASWVLSSGSRPRGTRPIRSRRSTPPASRRATGRSRRACTASRRSTISAWPPRCTGSARSRTRSSARSTWTA